MSITEQEEASAYFEKLVTHHMTKKKVSRKEAESIERQNLGYWAGYFDQETRLRVESLFSTVHPVFGSAEKPPTVEEAFRLGFEKGQALRKSQEEREREATILREKAERDL